MSAHWKAVEVDVYSLMAGQDVAELPLWWDGKPVVINGSDWKRSVSRIPGGSFWADWYQRILDGRPNWPLWRDVALIDNALWEQGGEALDTEIRRIVKRHQLLDEVRRLRAELAEAQPADAAIAHRGHNNPPELVQPYSTEIAPKVERIVETLNEAEQELQQQRPSPSVLRKVAQGLKAAVVAVLGYCAKLGDLAAQGVAKEIGASVGKWAGRGIIGYIALNSVAFQKLAEALRDLAGKL